MADYLKSRLNGTSVVRRHRPLLALVVLVATALVGVAGIDVSTSSSGPTGGTMKTALAVVASPSNLVVLSRAMVHVASGVATGPSSALTSGTGVASNLRPAKVSSYSSTTSTAVARKAPDAAVVKRVVARHHGAKPRRASPTTTRPVTTKTVLGPRYPVGVTNASEPSGYAPPSGLALPGYSQSYVTDFSGSALPSGWVSYSGKPMSDPGAQFGVAHVVVGGGLLQLNTWRDPQYNNIWVTGGLSQSAVTNTYGAYFVRSRLTGAGPTGVELLWPADNSWPPEIDFSETAGDASNLTATVHFGPASVNHIDQRALGNVDMTKWHTWGVIWTPTSITYTVDGNAWGSVAVGAEIPNVPMTLDLQQQTWCDSGWACPSAPQSMQVDWVAEYRATLK